MGKLPAFQFYPNDWRSDPELCRCSKSARDTWMDMLCLMFFCEERGVLVTSRVPWSEEEIAAAVRGPSDANLADVRELLTKGVARRRGDGAIYCLRMVRDEQERGKTKERVNAHRLKRSCNDDVTPLKRSCTEEEVEEEVGVDVVSQSKPIPVSFYLDDFDGQIEFQKLCKAHPQPEDGIRVQDAWQRTIEREIELAPGSKRAPIAQRILEQARLYAVTPRSFTYGLSSWLTKGIWKQSPEVWRGPEAINARQRKQNDAIERAFSEDPV